MCVCLDELLKLFVIASDCKCTSNELIFMLKVIFHWRPSKCNCTGYEIICSRAMDLFKRALHVFAFARVHSLSRAQTYLVVNEQHVELEIGNVYLWWFHRIFCKALFIKCLFSCFMQLIVFIETSEWIHIDRIRTFSQHTEWKAMILFVPFVVVHICMLQFLIIYQF